MHRFHAALGDAGLDGTVVLDHRVFPLELVNARPTPKRTLDAEVTAIRAIAPSLGMRVWTAAASEWPVTVLLALEAVQAAKREIGLAASEQLDFALRRAMFCESRCISMRDVVLDVAAGCNLVDVDVLRDAIDDGRHRRAVLDDHAEAAHRDDIDGSPHAFLPDGTSSHNPGITFHHEGDDIVIDDDDEGAWRRLVTAASASAA